VGGAAPAPSAKQLLAALQQRWPQTKGGGSPLLVQCVLPVSPDADAERALRSVFDSGHSAAASAAAVTAAAP
jgi:hypothetical protein